MTDRQILTKLLQDQQSIMVAITGLADIADIHTQMIQVVHQSQSDLAEWLKRPPSNDLSEAIKRMAATGEATYELVVRLVGAQTEEHV